MAMSRNEQPSFGALLKAFRTRRHLTQQQLSVAVSAHRSTIGRWERGDVLPASKTIVLELAKPLHLDDQETRQLLEASLTALSSYWHVPFPRNPFFTAREKILEALHRRLHTERMVALTQSYALHGLGGIGKTQIVLEYAYRHALEYSAVFWVGAETEEQIISSLLRIAEVLHLSGQDDNNQQHMVAAVQRWLTTHSQWLLIWDNLEDLALLDRFLPPIRQGAILITTRCQALGTRARGIDLLPMEHEEGLLFVLRRAKVLESEGISEHLQHLAMQMPLQYAAARELVEAVGGLPLALDQAGAYIEETQCGLPAYLNLFRVRRAALLQQRGEGSRDHPASVSTTFILAITATAERHPAIWDLLQVCALIQPDAIPEELFRQGAEYLGETLEAACHDELEWNRVVSVACSYSLLHRQPEEQTLSMHRLVQAVLQEFLPERGQHIWRTRVLRAMSQLFPADEKMQADYWQSCERLLSHALVCLTWSEQRGEEAQYITLMSHVATYLAERSRDAEAEALYLRAIRLGEQSLGAEHPQVSEALHGLANLSRKQGKYIEAESLYLRAVRIGEQTRGAEHPEVATSLHGLASFYINLGRYVEAEVTFQRALAIRERTLGTEHLQVATSLQGLAMLYGEQGKYAEAKPLYQRALAIREQTLGAEHPQVAVVLYNMAEDYKEQGRYDEAEPLFQRALQIWGQALGSEHPRVAHPLNSLAELYRAQGRYEEAGSLFQRALHIWEQALGSRHRLVAESLNGLAILFQEQGRYGEAEALFQRALQIREQQLGQQHPETAQTLYDLAVFCQKQGHLDKALSLAERALSIFSQSLGATHPKAVAIQALSEQLVQEQICAQREAISEQDEDVKEVPDPLSEELHIVRGAPPLREAVDPSRAENNLLQGFLDAYCELHPRAWCRSVDLWRAYECWAEEHHERFLLSRRAFSVQLKSYGCRADRTKTARIWRGITIAREAAHQKVTPSDAR